MRSEEETEFWNDITCKNNYEWIQEHANKYGVDISHPYLDKICKKTKSPRVQQLIIEAYCLGQARATIMIDNRKNVITLDDVSL